VEVCPDLVGDELDLRELEAKVQAFVTEEHPDDGA